MMKMNLTNSIFFFFWCKFSLDIVIVNSFDQDNHVVKICYYDCPRCVIFRVPFSPLVRETF